MRLATTSPQPYITLSKNAKEFPISSPTTPEHEVATMSSCRITQVPYFGCKRNTRMQLRDHAQNVRLHSKACSRMRTYTAQGCRTTRTPNKLLSSQASPRAEDGKQAFGETLFNDRVSSKAPYIRRPIGPVQSPQQTKICIEKIKNVPVANGLTAQSHRS